MQVMFTADWHLRGERPRCRTDLDWLESQRRDVAYIVEMANKHADMLVIAGDIFHLPRVATEVVNMALEELGRAKVPVQILAGNHDLPYHSYENVERCSFGTLRRAGFLQEISGPSYPICGWPFGLDKACPSPVRVLHRLVFPNAEARPIEGIGFTAEEILAEFPESRLIITGDYHHSFVFEGENGRTLINPGCINIQAADMIGYQPVIALVDTDTHKCSWFQIPAAADSVVTDEYLTEAKARDERIEAFLDAVAKGGGVTLSFTDNVERKSVGLKKGVQSKVYSIMREATSEV
jgi:DNA repair exonuclease SbcCD nuclease subunit